MTRVITEYNGIACWVDVAQVLSLTGETVTPLDMAKAQGTLNVITEVDPAMLPTNLLAGDRKRLEDMLCYQAPWLKGRVDYFAEVDTTQVSQDGISATYASQYATKLAPMANMCFQRLSWNRRGIRTTRSRKTYATWFDVRDAVLRGEECDTTGVGGIIRPSA